MSAPVPLAEFDPPVARAVVAVLRRAGVPAAVADDASVATVGPELTVVVPSAQRDEALAAMAAGMEEIQAELAQQPAASAPAADAPEGEDGDEEPTPLLFERMRRLGFLPVLLVPLLVVTLSQTRLPAVYAVALIVGGSLAVVAWRDGRRVRGED